MTSNLAEIVETIQDPVLRKKAKALLAKERRYLRGVARSDDRGRVGRIGWDQATIQEHGGEKYVVTPRVEGVLDRAPVKKRSDAERVESLARRFWDTIKDNPSMAPLVLQELQAEYWKAGQTVAYEDIKQAAIELLKKAAIEAEKAERKRRGAIN